MIIPNPWLTNLLQTSVRRFVVESSRIISIVHFKFSVFPKVVVDTEIVILQKANPAGWTAKVHVVNDKESFVSPPLQASIQQIEHY
jgi:hypothetical protein